MDIPRKARRVAEPSMIPLINVIFLLLEFFMIAGTVAKPDIFPINLPSSSSGHAVEDGPVVLVLSRKGEIAVNDQSVAPDAFYAEIQKQLAGDPERVITVRADAGMQSHRLVDVLDSIKAAGGRNVALTTERN